MTLTASKSEYFAVDPQWAALANEFGFPPQSDLVPPQDPIEPAEMDFSAARDYQKGPDEEWKNKKFLDAAGYESRLVPVKVRDGTEISVKVSCPNASRVTRHQLTVLPVLFVTHGGGYISGSHESEEAWLLRPLYGDLDLVIISVEYRLGPENKFPIWINDSWDVLERLIQDSGSFTSGLSATCDLSKLILAGSSAGGGISAVLSQMCRDKGVPVHGVVLNVPMVCDYRHFPSPKGTSDSYFDCNQDFMGSAHLVTCWNTLAPSEITGKDPMISPLLGNVSRLPPHLLFVAGRDPLRDEGIAYGEKLDAAGIAVHRCIYKGVPHDFAQHEELQATQKFSKDLVAGIQGLLPTQAR